MDRLKLAEGKTKIIWAIPGNDCEVIIESKDDITAGDGAKRDTIEGKGALSNETTSNCFYLLNNKGMPTHFLKKVSKRSFRARRVKMIPVELVARRIATGSYLKRSPGTQEGTIFPDLKIEFFLKDDSRHDPMMIWDNADQCFMLYDAKKPLSKDSFVGALRSGDLPGIPDSLAKVQQLQTITTKVFLVLEEAWAYQDVSLVDLKIECGYDEKTKEVVVADVIDNDSWRIWPAGDKTQMKDKQVYRNLQATTPEALGAVKKNYAWVAEATAKFLS